MGSFEGYCSRCSGNADRFLRVENYCNNCYSDFCLDCYYDLQSCSKCNEKLCGDYTNKCGNCDYILCKYCDKFRDFCFDCFTYKCLGCNKCQCIKEKTYLHLLPKDTQNVINEMLKRT